MSDLDPRSSDTDRLTGKLLDGLLDAEETRRLGVLLKASGPARDRYCDLVMLHSLLQWRSMSSEIPLPIDPNDAEVGSGLDLNSAMILPAIQIDEVDAPDELVGSSTAKPSSYHPGVPPGNDRIAAFPQAAAPQGDGVGSVRRRKFTRVWLLAASVLVVTSLGAAVAYISMIQRSRAADVATLTGTIDARWDDAPAQVADGTALPLDQELSLRSGWAELAYPNGVVVTVEGPARFSIRPGQTLSLRSGKLVALVPKAGHGFAVSTPSARVVDLGTEFGVAVNPAGETDVDTFRGTVSITPATGATASASTLVSAGFATHVSSTGIIADVAANDDAFVRPQQFADWNSTSHAASYESWRVYSERLRHDPDLIAYYTFSNAAQAPDRLLNQSSLGSALDGVLGGGDPTALPIWTTGRWPEKGALEFGKGHDSRVVVPSGIGDPLDFSHGQQPASALTIAAWIRPEARASATIAAKGFAYSEQFSLETARGWIRQTAGNVGVGDLKPWSTVPAVGVWSQLVLTYDPISRNTCVYRDGVLIADAKDSPSQLIPMDAPMTIGCGTNQQRNKPGGDVGYVSALHGRIDELLIMRRAMSAEEVRGMYLMEKPN
jgi:hypothetical protein